MRQCGSRRLYDDAMSTARPDAPAGTLPGPRRVIVVEPLERPAERPAPAPHPPPESPPAPERDPAQPEAEPQRV
jgi:hypothetical protein